MDRKTYNRKAKALLVTFLAAASPAVVSHAADYFWSGGTGTYNNPAAWGGKVPGTNDLAFNNSGSNNVVQINAGDPDWNVNGIRAGSIAASGGFEQNGQSLNISNTVSGIRLGIADGSTGVFTLNNGTINYGSGQFNVGELGTGILNVNDGSITGSGNFFVNLGSSTAAVTASMDGGEAATGFTWFEQGFDTADTTRGLPPAGSTFTSASQTDHSYALAPSFSMNDSVMVNTSVGATVTLVSPAAYSGLSFLGSAGHGPMTVNYTVHHSDSTTETGSFTVLDWFNNGGTIAYRAGARVHADGTGIETHGVATNDTPYLFSIDISVSSASPVASIDLSCDTGNGTVCLLALSGSSGGDFSPVAIAGYNEDMIVEADAIPVVSGSVTDTFTQTGGNLNITGGGQFIVGNIGVGVYNLSGGTNTVHNYIAFGRSGGNGTVNMTGGELDQAGGGNLLVGTGFQSPASGSPVGVLNQSGGVINSQGQFLVPENSPATGTYNLSGTGVLNVNNWIAIGRDNGVGNLNISGGVITKTGDNSTHFTIGSGGTGTLTQTGGAITNTVSDFWLGQSADGIWNLNGGLAVLSVLHICQDAGVTGTLNLNGGDLTVQEITSGNIGSFSLINLNGGVIHASADNDNFMHDVTQVFVGTGGAIFDSQDFSINIPESLLDNGGGLTKVGAGTLYLTGFNSYSGPTFVNEGTLVESTTTTAFGDRTIADGATYGVQVESSGGQISPGNLTVGDSTGASLDFQLGSLGNPTVAPLNVSGTFTVNGTVMINITGTAPQVGSFPLVQYGTRAGSGHFVIGSIPVGTTAEIVTNASGNSIDLNFTSVDLPRWDGQVNGNWDIGVTENWINTGNGSATVYNEGDSVLFDDNASGTTDVNLADTVHPGGVRVNNSSRNYSLNGSGKISGSTSLIKQGSGTLTIGAVNDFTGPTVIQGGNVTVSNLSNGGSPSAIGASSADPANLVLAGGALTYAGPATSINRGYSVQGDQGAINAESNLTLSGLVTAS
ncbi:MAG TPA: autotransporter-associated beta strand repeat-containing protein, partial [Verrucomicrobiae bacterium]|nr:autotransporter-associated beta strand repeat-containing protein [Verrucomicrobiae bacterium]